MTPERLREAAQALRHPIPNAVDLALADWLDDYASTLDCFGGGRPDDRTRDNCPALRVADAILGGDRIAGGE